MWRNFNWKIVGLKLEPIIKIIVWRHKIVIRKREAISITIILNQRY